VPQSITPSDFTIALCGFRQPAPAMEVADGSDAPATASKPASDQKIQKIFD
jgi:hypothetical protein